MKQRRSTPTSRIRLGYINLNLDQFKNDKRMCSIVYNNSPSNNLIF